MKKIIENKINKILLVLIIILLAILFVLIYQNKQPAFYAVYLETGELYFGNLHYFPYFYLDNVYFLTQVNNQFQLSKFENTAWSPEDKIYLTRSKIVWIAKIKENSQLIEIISGFNNKKKLITDFGQKNQKDQQNNNKDEQ